MISDTKKATKLKYLDLVLVVEDGARRGINVLMNTVRSLARGKKK